MPVPEKERRSGRLGRLLAALRPSRAGPLPVQTGFPTSLADLFVKNHGRLKKQPSPSSSSSSNSKRRKGGVSSSASPSSHSPSPSPPPSSSPPAPLPSPGAAAVSRVYPPRPDPSPARVVRRNESRGFGLGLGFLAVSGVVSLALLVIWSKKVVAAVTVASFSLFLLESLRCSSLRRRPRMAATERQLCLDGRGRVSPIREAEAETEPSQRPSCSDSDGGIDASVLAAEERSAVLVHEWSDSKAKTKGRSWKKLIADSAKKLHKGRKHHKEAEDCLGSFRSDGDRGDATLLGGVKATDSSSASRPGMASDTDVVADAITADEPDSLGSRRLRTGEIHVISPTEVDAPADLTKDEEEEDVEEVDAAAGEAGIRFPALVLVAVVLAGLVAGKLPAVACTMLCAALFCSVRRFQPPAARRRVAVGGDWSSPSLM